MATLKAVFTGRKWWRYVPDQSLFTRGAGGGKGLNAAARSLDGDGAIVYLSSPATVSIDLGKITAAATLRASWVNTESGEASLIGLLPSRGVRDFSTPPSRPDAVLLLDAVKP